MENIFNCPKCKEEFNLDNPKCEAYYMDEDEDENGNHRWAVEFKCPYCGYEFCEEVWDDGFGD